MINEMIELLMNKLIEVSDKYNVKHSFIQPKSVTGMLRVSDKENFKSVWFTGGELETTKMTISFNKNQYYFETCYNNGGASGVVVNKDSDFEKLFLSVFLSCNINKPKMKTSTSAKKFNETFADGFEPGKIYDISHIPGVKPSIFYNPDVKETLTGKEIVEEVERDILIDEFLDKVASEIERCDKEGQMTTTMKGFKNIILRSACNPNFLGLNKKDRQKEYKLSNDDIRELTKRFKIESLYATMEREAERFLKECTAKL